MTRGPSLALAVCGALLGVAPTSPVSAAEGARIPGPAWFQENVVYYQDFSSALTAPCIDDAHLTLNTKPNEVPIVPEGFLGNAASLERKGYLLSGAALSPDHPITLSCWWSLPKDLPITGGFGIFALRGKGFISSFIAGKGDWCALGRPTGVLQVQSLPGIPNVNDLYDYDFGAHVALTAHVWHHTALVIEQASIVRLIVDGQTVGEVKADGRRFSERDELISLVCGGGIIIDEFAVLSRAIDVALIRDYVIGMRRLREYQR